MSPVNVTWYDDPQEAERDLEAHFQAMTPDERVTECLRLMVFVAGWQERGRMERVARMVDVP